MELKNILIDDTNGDLSGDLFKLHPERTSLSSWFSEDAEEAKRVLNFSTNNVRYASIPNMASATYLTFLAYNGTLGLKDKVFSTVVANDNGVLDMNAAPVLTYNPDQIQAVRNLEELEDTVIDIKMYNGTVDVITYQEGILFQGEKIYRAKSIRSYPTIATKLPNVDFKKVFLDGWYSYTHVIYRDVLVGASVDKDAFYGYAGQVFKASDNGVFATDIVTGDLYIVSESGANIMQSTEIDYTEILFSLNATSSTSAHGNSVYLHSQVLITEEIRDAITKETLAVAMTAKSGVDFADWQKLTLKRSSASIMFGNELYENAQIILESARSQCVDNGYDTCN